MKSCIFLVGNKASKLCIWFRVAAQGCLCTVIWIEWNLNFLQREIVAHLASSWGTLNLLPYQRSSLSAIIAMAQAVLHCPQHLGWKHFGTHLFPHRWINRQNTHRHLWSFPGLMSSWCFPVGSSVPSLQFELRRTHSFFTLKKPNFQVVWRLL